VLFEIDGLNVIVYRVKHRRKASSGMEPPPAKGYTARQGVVLHHGRLDVLLAALSEFVRRNRIELKERFAREDIEKELNLTEGRGTGIPEILRTMKADGSPTPRFETDDDRTYFVSYFPAYPLAVSKETLKTEICSG